jgi:hypothetical protein
MKRTTTEAELREMAKTMTTAEIAKKLGHRRNYLCYAFMILGIKPVKHKMHDHEAIVRNLENGISLKEQAIKSGVSFYALNMQTRYYKLPSTVGQAVKAKMERENMIAKAEGKQ